MYTHTGNPDIEYTWRYAVGDFVTILAIYATMYENALNIDLNTTRTMAYLMFASCYFDFSVFLEVETFLFKLFLYTYSNCIKR